MFDAYISDLDTISQEDSERRHAAFQLLRMHRIIKSKENPVI